MPLFKRRPDIKLFAPRVIMAGRPVRVRVVLDCEESVPVDAVSVALVGTGVWYTSSQYGRHRNTQAFARWVARPVAERRALESGVHELRVSFELPADAPASYRGRLFSVEWTIQVHVDIPWWPDARSTFMVHVARVPTTPAQPAPRRVFASSSQGPRPRKPYAEVSLGTTVVASGERLHGRVALANTAHNQYRALRVALVAVETVPTLLSTTSQHDRVARWVVPLTEPTEDAPIDFALALPSGLVPGFRTLTVTLEWFLEVRVDVAWARDLTLWIPVDIEPRRAEGDGEVAAPLAVGSQRLALVWTEAARQAGYEYADGTLVREIGGNRLVIRREHRGRRGLRLLGEALLADVGLGLRTSRGGLRCRDAGQDRVLRAWTEPSTRDCPVIEADDQRIACAVDDTGTRIEPVRRLAEGLVALVEALEGAREVLPAPADMAALVPSFRAAARRLGGALSVAAMEIRGVRDQVPFSLRTRWDDEGARAGIALGVCPTLPIDARWHQRWDGDEAPGPMPPGLAPLVADARSLAVDAESIQLVFDPIGDDLEPHVARLESLLSVARRLSGQGPGYR